MSKILNQLLYSAVVFGSDAPSGVLRLESTSSGTKGTLELVGSQFDLIVNNQIGRLVHTNTGLRTYTLPDVSGNLLVSGMLTEANQLIYSSAASEFAILDALAGGCLVTDLGGNLTWVQGLDNQVLTIVAGAPVFQDLPDVGTVGESLVGNELPYYAVSGKDLVPLTTQASRTMISLGDSTLAWGLISATYLKATGDVPLALGDVDQVLAAVGDGTFKWVTPTSAVILEGDLNRIPFYSADPSGTEVAASSFMANNESAHVLAFLNKGGVRFYELELNGNAFVEFRAASDLGVSTTFILPPSDGLPNAVLVTDGSGNLSFQTLPDTGSVATSDANNLAYYAVGGNDVSGLPSVPSRILGTSALGVPNWMLISEAYLKAAGGVPLAGGLLDQVLVSTGASEFAWKTAADITGQVLSGVGNRLAFYPTTGTKVDDISFLSVEASSLNLLTGSTLRIHAPSGVAYVELSASAALAANLSFRLPSEDGDAGQALVTDGLGGLSFITVGRGIVNAGVQGTLAYYATSTNEVQSLSNIAGRAALTDNGTNEVFWGLLTAAYLSDDAGNPLAVGDAGQLLSAVGDGTFAWYTLTASGVVTPAQGGQIPYYLFDGDTVDGSDWLYNNELFKRLELHSAGKLSLFDSLDAYSVSLSASDALTDDIEFKLPSTLPMGNGYVVTSELDGTMSLVPPSGDVRWEQRGVISVPAGVRSITVIYDTPFTAPPAYVDVQWAIGVNDVFLPSYAIEQSTEQGFIIRLSSAIPSGDYKIYWESQLAASTTLLSAIYFAGGETAGSVYLNSIQRLYSDLDTTVSNVASLSSNRGYMASAGSSTTGYLFGGDNAPASPIDTISSMDYATLATVDLPATLTSTKSGATGIGTRSMIYIAGGYSGVALSSIDSFDTATETVLAALAAILSSAAYKRASANSATKGVIVHNAGSIDLLDYATESIVISTQNFGVPDISVGANSHTTGYFGRDTGGALSKYAFATNTLSGLPISLSSTTGLSMAGNSLEKAYFGGTAIVEGLDFVTETLVSSASLPITGRLSASATAFQSKGLL